MSANSIKVAWKDAEYRKSVSETKRAVPSQPGRLLELADADLADVVGGGWFPGGGIIDWIKDWCHVLNTCNQPTRPSGSIVGCEGVDCSPPSVTPDPSNWGGGPPPIPLPESVCIHKSEQYDQCIRNVDGVDGPEKCADIIPQGCK